MIIRRRPNRTLRVVTSKPSYSVLAVVRPVRSSRSVRWKRLARAGPIGTRWLRRAVLTNGCSLWYPRSGSTRTATRSSTGFVLIPESLWLSI